MGGKFRQGPKIAEFAHRVLTPDKWYVEPFCGALGAASRVAHNKMILNDICKPLILMWKGLYEGTIELPDCVTEEEYNWYKEHRPMDDWMTAFCGFGLSFGGKWFGGYARHTRGVEDPYHYARGAVKDANRRMDLMNECKIRFSHENYASLKIPDMAVVYYDPPYTGRTKAHAFNGSFNVNEYWSQVRHMTRRALVLVTAFEIPDDFKVLYSWGDTVVRHHAGKGSDGTSEVLACHRTQYKIFQVDSDAKI